MHGDVRKEQKMTGDHREYKLTLRAADAPPIVVPSYTVEVYFALSEE